MEVTSVLDSTVEATRFPEQARSQTVWEQHKMRKQKNVEEDV